MQKMNQKRLKSFTIYDNLRQQPIKRALMLHKQIYLNLKCLRALIKIHASDVDYIQFTPVKLNENFLSCKKSNKYVSKIRAISF